MVHPWVVVTISFVAGMNPAIVVVAYTESLGSMVLLPSSCFRKIQIFQSHPLIVGEVGFVFNDDAVVHGAVCWTRWGQGSVQVCEDRMSESVRWHGLNLRSFLLDTTLGCVREDSQSPWLDIGACCIVDESQLPRQVRILLLLPSQ